MLPIREIQNLNVLINILPARLLLKLSALIRKKGKKNWKNYKEKLISRTQRKSGDKMEEETVSS